MIFTEDSLLENMLYCIFLQTSDVNDFKKLLRAFGRIMLPPNSPFRIPPKFMFHPLESMDILLYMAKEVT